MNILSTKFQILNNIKIQLLYLIAILCLASFLRFYGLNWDQGHHLHPDERAIVMFAMPLEFPNSLEEFLSTESPLNPHFFAYGNFPLYLLKITASFLANFDPLYLSYDKINLVGRAISGIADIGTIFIIFLIAKKLFNSKVALLASFFYAISVFPIQTAHFYAVDTLLTFFITLTLFQLIRFYEKPSRKNAAIVGVCFGLSLVTKISAIPLVVAIFAAITVDFILIFLKQPHKPHIWFPHVPSFLKRLIIDGLTIIVVTIITFAIFQPYALIDFQEFWKQSNEQRKMTYDAFTFPYTLQYVGKIPYWYELKNMFLWGLGPILAMPSFLGIFYVCYKTMKQWNNGTIIILLFFLTYFIIVGNFAVGWMRYLLPLYPLLAIFAAVFIYQIYKYLRHRIKSNFILNTLYLILYTFLLVWPLSFMNIYTRPNTRVLASEWIYENIPSDKTLAIEHWDDGMPIGGNIIYKTLELPIYGMSDPSLEREIYQKVQEADYIIIASNRLYTPLQRIYKNCQKWILPKDKCSHNANKYYQRLFNGELGYRKVAEFENPPTIPFLNISINDQSADESFTVYDHPKILIFQNYNSL